MLSSIEEVPMARIVVMNEKDERVLLDESVQPIHFEDEHASLQILERLAWAIAEAHASERHVVHA
jgi:hypothetical protein